MFLSIIIPLYNEENHIIDVLDKIENLNLKVSNLEIIIIDDNSDDNSLEVVKYYAKDKAYIIIEKHKKNLGKGAAIQTALKIAKGDVFLFQDADLELDPNDIPRMLDVMQNLNVEFVNGSRYMDGIYRPLSSYWRYVANKIFTILTSIIINVKITDMACGYKLIHRNLLKKIHLKEMRFGIEAELMIKALRMKRNNIVEIPVQYFPRTKDEGKKLGNLDAMKILWKIIKYGLFRVN